MFEVGLFIVALELVGIFLFKEFLLSLYGGSLLNCILAPWLSNFAPLEVLLVWMELPKRKGRKMKLYNFKIEMQPRK